MDHFGNDEIARLLRLKRYEQPPPDYFENFLYEFRRRQRDEFLRQSLWRICFERAQGFGPFLGILRPRYRGSDRMRLSNFNPDLSATRHSSVRRRELAGSEQVTQYRETIGFPASDVDSAFRHAVGCSPCKQQGYSDAAGTAG